MFRSLERHTTQIFLAALLAFAAGGALARYHTEQHDEADAWVAHTGQVITELDATLSLLNAAESQERGYLLSADQRFVAPFEGDGALLARHIADARALDGDTPAQRDRLDTLAGLVERKLEAMRMVMSVRRADGLDSALHLLGTSADATDLRGVRDSVLALERDERRRLVQRRDSLAVTTRRVSWASLAFDAISLVMLALAFATARAARRRQRLAERRTAQANEELQLRVEELLHREEELVQRGRESVGLQRLGEALQLCLTRDEAYAAIARILPHLLADEATGGVLAITRASRNRVEVVARWGDAAVADVREALDAFEPEDCCALRSGRPYVARAGDARLRCAHGAATGEDYVCLPLAAHGETLGVLHVALPVRERTQRSTAAGPDRLALLKQASELIAVALANLVLRDHLKQQSIRDALTGAYNRRYLEESLARELTRARRHAHGPSVVMIDVDHFKRVNDQHGHETGDAVLREIADVLRRTVRADDIVCRYGGEEFAIVLPDLGADAAVARGDAIVTACRSAHIRVNGQPVGPVTVSAGLAVHAHGEETVAELLRRADAALYVAKREGRDRLALAAGQPRVAPAV